MYKGTNKQTVNRQLKDHDNKYTCGIQNTAQDRYNERWASADLVWPASHEQCYDDGWKSRKHHNTKLDIRGICLYLL